MSEEIIKVLDELGKRFGIAIDWTSENVLPYAEELTKKFVNYEIATSILWIVFWALLFTIALVTACKLIPKADWYDEFDPVAVTSVICILLSVGLGIAFCVNLIERGLNIVTCLTFPEKAIFEYLNTIM